MEDLSALRRDVRLLKGYALLMTTVVASLLLLGATKTQPNAAFDTLRVQRIDIVDADGKSRMVMTGPQHMPGAGGPTDSRPEGRNFKAPAILFYDENGHEYGGLVPRATMGDTSMTAMIFDYKTQEAGGFFTQQKADGSGFAALLINDPPPATMPHSEAIKQSFNRIRITNPDQNAEMILSDTAGKPRIQLRVTKDGEAYLEILDGQGKVAFRAPEKRT